MKQSYLDMLFSMRLIVGFLGEKAQFAWWATAYYEPIGRLPELAFIWAKKSARRLPSKREQVLA
jgi:hypothetical protein